MFRFSQVLTFHGQLQTGVLYKFCLDSWEKSTFIKIDTTPPRSDRLISFLLSDKQDIMLVHHMTHCGFECQLNSCFQLINFSQVLFDSAFGGMLKIQMDKSVYIKLVTIQHNSLSGLVSVPSCAHSKHDVDLCLQHYCHDHLVLLAFKA
jgi:hypothetical protein